MKKLIALAAVAVTAGCAAPVTAAQSPRQSPARTTAPAAQAGCRAFAVTDQQIESATARDRRPENLMRTVQRQAAGWERSLSVARGRAGTGRVAVSIGRAERALGAVRADLAGGRRAAAAEAWGVAEGGLVRVFAACIQPR